MNLKHSLQQILDDLILVLLTSVLDLLDFGLGLLVGFVFSLLVPLGVLTTTTYLVYQSITQMTGISM